MMIPTLLSFIHPIVDRNSILLVKGSFVNWAMRIGGLAFKAKNGRQLSRLYDIIQVNHNKTVISHPVRRTI